MVYQSFRNRQEWYVRIFSEGYSSSSVYGDNPELPKHVRMHLPKAWITTFGKGMMPNPLSPYAVSKLAGGKYCQVFSQKAKRLIKFFRIMNIEQGILNDEVLKPQRGWNVCSTKLLSSILKPRRGDINN